MSEKKEAILHVKIQHLDSLLREAEAALNRVARRDYDAAEAAMMAMRHILANMEPTDRAALRDTEKRVTEEYMALAKSRSRSLKTRRVSLRFPVYFEWLKDIQDALWAGGYWSNEKYGFHDPSGGKKS